MNRPAGNAVIEAVYHPEGRVFYTAGASPRYEYTIKDHLGNARLTFSDLNANGKIDQTTTATNEVLQENHYYPFGLGMNGAWINSATALDNLYQYNGKELNNDWGLNMLDYGARMYMPELGRWNGVDALAEKYVKIGTYVYVANSPFSNLDPNGKEVIVQSLDKKNNTYNRYTYSGGKLIDSKGGVYNGNDRFLNTTLNNLNRLSEMEVVQDVVRSLECSENQHFIRSVEAETGKDNHNSDLPGDDQKGESRGSTTQYDIDNYNDPENKDLNRDPVIALAHELSHAKERDNGTIDENRKKEPISGVSWTEINPVNLENFARKSLDVPLRTSYGGDQIPSKYLKKP